MIYVYILSDNAKSERVKTVKRIFNDPRFNVAVVSVLPTESADDVKSGNANDDMRIEHHRVMRSLNDAHINHPKSHCIVVKDTTITSATSKDIGDIVSKFVVKDDMDISYLCKWMDRCDLYTHREQVLSGGSMIVKTQSPNGIQCVLFSPHGRDIVLGRRKMTDGNIFKLLRPHDIGYSLNKEILNNNISASAVVPNLVDYDPTAARCNDDYNKGSECVNPDDGASEGSSATSFWWILLLIILIIIIVFVVIKLKNSYY